MVYITNNSNKFSNIINKKMKFLTFIANVTDFIINFMIFFLTAYITTRICKFVESVCTKKTSKNIKKKHLSRVKPVERLPQSPLSYRRIYALV